MTGRRFTYERKKLSLPDLQLWEALLGVILAYREQGVVLNIRQLFYEGLRRGCYPNRPRDFKRVCRLWTGVRRCGLADWDLLCERQTPVYVIPTAVDVDRHLQMAADNFWLDPWAGQPMYGELLITSEAYEGTLQPLVRRWRLRASCFSNCPTINDSQRLATRLRGHIKAGRVVRLWLLTGLDPFSQRWEKTLRRNLTEYMRIQNDAGYEVMRVALTALQVEEQSLPLATALRTTAAKYPPLDALPASVLLQELERHVRAIVDPEAWHATIVAEAEQKQLLRERFGQPPPPAEERPQSSPALPVAL
jgi:hypothetical protein